MKAKLKSLFLPFSSLRDSYFQLDNLIEGSLSMEEYIREFEKLLIKCDIQN